MPRPRKEPWDPPVSGPYPEVLGKGAEAGGIPKNMYGFERFGKKKDKPTSIGPKTTTRGKVTPTPKTKSGR